MISVTEISQYADFETAAGAGTFPVTTTAPGIAGENAPAAVSSNSTPHPSPMASQARHDSVTQLETDASRPVVPSRGGEGVDLSAAETQELQDREAVIERGLKTFLEVGDCLIAIREKRLYRARYCSFEQYVNERWDFGARQAQRLMASAEIVENIKALGGDSLPLPATESQVRPLSGLPAAEQFSIWRDAAAVAQLSNGGKITAKIVNEVVKRRQGEPSPQIGPIVDAKPGGTREQRAREATTLAIQAVNVLLAIPGAAESVWASHASAALGKLYETDDQILREEWRKAKP